MPKKKVSKDSYTEVFELWDNLVAHHYFTAEELELVTGLNGMKVQTLIDAMEVRYGISTWKELHKKVHNV